MLHKGELRTELANERPKPTPRPPSRDKRAFEFVNSNQITEKRDRHPTLEYVEMINETLRLLLVIDKSIGASLPDNDIKKAICALTKIQVILFSQSSTSRISLPMDHEGKVEQGI